MATGASCHSTSIDDVWFSVTVQLLYDSRHRMRSLRSSILILIAFSAFAIVVTYPQIVVFRTSIADHTDPPFSIWRLGWVAHQLATDPLRIWDANIFYPEPSTF